VIFKVNTRFGFTIDTSEIVLPSAMVPSMLTTARFQSRWLDASVSKPQTRSAGASMRRLT